MNNKKTYIKSFDICMIVKNEENNLKLTLPNMVSVADNVIVVDTGSNDNTKLVVLTNGAKVFDFKWVNDYSAARNHSLGQSKADWILWLDADEFMDVEDLSAIRAFIETTDRNLIYLPIYECKYGTRESGSYYLRDKLFMNIKGVHFEKSVNEQVTLPEGIEKKGSIFIDAKVYHWGLDLSPDIMNRKTEDRIKMLEGAVQKDTKDYMVSYLLAIKYQGKKMVEESIKEYDRLIEMTYTINTGDIVFFREAALMRKSWIYYDRNALDQAINEAERVLETNKGYIEPYCVMALSYIKLGDHQKAMDIIEKALELPKIIHPIKGQNDKMWDVMRYFLYVRCLLNLKGPEVTLKYVDELTAKFPENQGLMEALGVVRAHINRPVP